MRSLDTLTRRMTNSMQFSNSSMRCWIRQQGTYLPILFYFSSGQTRTIPKLPRFSHLPPPGRTRVPEYPEFARQGEATLLQLPIKKR